MYRSTMRKSMILVSILLASIFFSLDLSPSVDAQGGGANVTVELNCTGNIGSWGVWETENHSLMSGGTRVTGAASMSVKLAGNCSIQNPSQYNIKIEIIQQSPSGINCCMGMLQGQYPNFTHTTGNESMIISLGPNSGPDDGFMGNIFIDAYANEATLGVHLANISARVIEINGEDCVSCLTVSDEFEFEVGPQLGDLNPNLPSVDNNVIQLFTYFEDIYEKVGQQKCWGQFDNRTTSPVYSTYLVGRDANSMIVCRLGHSDGKVGRTIQLDENGTIDISIPILFPSLPEPGNITELNFEVIFGVYDAEGSREWDTSVLVNNVSIILDNNNNSIGQTLNANLPLTESTSYWGNITTSRTTISADSVIALVVRTDGGDSIWANPEWYMTSCGNQSANPPNCLSYNSDDPFSTIPHIASITLPIIDSYNEEGNSTNDSDGDGVPDSEDPFPYDANETHDDDNDGVGNNSDAFPQDGNETHDDDGDGVGNNSDDFPQDPEETTDTDGDGVGDNSDADPDDPDVRIPADLEINVTDTALYVLAAAFLLMAVALVVNRRKKPPEVMGASEVYDSDTIWNES